MQLVTKYKFKEGHLTMQSKDIEKIKEVTAEDFLKEYNKLVEKMGFQILAVPAYKMRDDSTYSLVIQMQVAQLPKNQ